MSERSERVMRVIEAARELSRDEALAARLVTTTGLSPEGVRLALREHLELEPTREQLSRLLEVTHETEHVHVILSANVFTAALRAIAIACAAAPVVTVRPSSREPHFATALVAAMKEPRVRIDPRPPAHGEIHVYGRDETIAEVKRSAAKGVVVRGHGAGMGIAVIDDAADLRWCARSLATDVVPFDQRGCLSPRVAFVAGRQRASAFAAMLHDALEDAEARVPRGRLDANESAELERWASTVAYAGELTRGRAHAIGCSAALLVPPAGRHVHVMAVDQMSGLPAVLAPIAKWIVAVGASSVESARAMAPAHARVSALGEMQKPPLDGPVDRRPS